METYKRVFVIVLDSLGIGAMPDSEKFGDKGVDTFGHILDIEDIIVSEYGANPPFHFPSLAFCLRPSIV